MTSKLPTERELKTLYKKKGKEALIWYAWRNSLRAVLLLERLSLQYTWGQNTIKHAYSVCRIPLVLANIPEIKTIDVATAAAIVEAVADAATHTAAYGSAAHTDGFAITAAAVDAVAHTANALTQTSVARFVAAAAKAARVATAYHSLSLTSSTADARADFDFLIKTSKPITDDWFSHSLWHKKLLTSSSEYKKERKEFDKRIQLFLKSFHPIGLEFLADDLIRLYQNEVNPVQQHWKKYLVNPSDMVFESAKSLHHFIFKEIEQINAVRVLILGPGGAGKTTLADRLQGKTDVKQHEATVGIDYLNHKGLQLDKKKGAFAGLDIPEKLNLYLWDFGGQTLFHGLHQAFLHENCVYILVVDSRHEQEPDEWLYQIRHLAKTEILPPVLIVVNEYENCQNTQNQTRLQQLFKGKLHFCYLRCNDPEDKRLGIFKKKLLDVAANARHSITKSVLDEGEKLKSKLKKKPVISRMDLRGYLRESFPIYELDGVLAQLEGLGYLVPIDTNKGDYCLNPTWTIDHAYQFLQLDCVRNSEGIVRIDDFEDAAWDLSKRLAANADEDYPVLDDKSTRFLFSFLKSSGVCIALNDNTNLFFPDVAPTNEPEIKSQLGIHFDKPQAVIEFLLPYFPIGLPARLVKHWMLDRTNRIEIPEDVWREGFVLSHAKDKHSFLIFRYQFRKSSIRVDCIGKQVNIASLLIDFWQSLLNHITPIRAEDIYPLVRMDKLILSDNQHLIKATQWLNDQTAIIKTLKSVDNQRKIIDSQNLKLEGAQMPKGKTIEINGDVNNTQFAFDHVNQTQNNLNPSPLESKYKTILLDAIQEVHATRMSSEQRGKLYVIEKQVEGGTLEKGLYDQLLPHLSTAANISSIVSTIASLIGLP